MDEPHMEFLNCLNQHVIHYMSVLQDLFGLRDPKFVIGSIQKSTHYKGDPQTNFPSGYHEDGGCIVDIHITPYAYQNCLYDLATWQVAHECVHLLDPIGLGGANILEEGLATWFQDTPRYHPENVQAFISTKDPHPREYAEAKELVASCMPELAFAVRTIRTNGIPLPKIQPNLLATYLPEQRVDRRVLTLLCRKFSRDS